MTIVTWRTLRLCLTLHLLCAFLTCAHSEETHLAITHVTVIDVEATSASGAKLEDQTVLISGKNIESISPTTTTELQQPLNIVDGTGMYLVPGYYDMHAHVAWAGDDTTKIILPLMFAHGITGIRELGSDSRPPNKTLEDLRQLNQAIENGEVLGPRLQSLSRLVNGRRNANASARESINPLTKEQGRAAARSAKQRGVDFVKVYSHISRDAYFGLLEEANRLQLPVAGHLPHAVTPIEASNAGMRSIEHARFPAYACGPGYEAWREASATNYSEAGQINISPIFVTHLERLVPEFDEKKCHEILETFAKNKTWLCPTHITRKMDAYASDPEYRADPRRKYIGPETLSRWDRDLDATARARPSIRKHYLEFFKLGLRVTGLAHQHGVGILVGTDCYDTQIFPGFSYHDEMLYLHEAGLSPLDILAAATIRACQFLEIENEFGSIKAGKRADMVLLNADPLADIRNAASIQGVIFNGKWHPQEELQAMIQAAESFANEKRKAFALLEQLCNAVLSDDLAALHTALKNGADINVLDTRSSGSGRRALNYAAIKNNVAMIEALVEAGADIDLANRTGFTPLMHAAEYGSTEAAQALIEAGANLALKNRGERTALDIAESRKHQATAEVLRQALPSTDTKQD